MFVGECSTGSALQVLLESGGTLIIVKTDCGYDAPWGVSGCVGRGALVMTIQALLKAISQSDIALVGVREALEEVYVSHLI